jgi:putative transposase
MPSYRRIKIPSGCYFFTVCLADRRATTLEDHILDLQAAWRWTQARLPFSSPAWVVLPDHIHCIWKLPPDDDNYALRWSLLKRHFTKALGKELALPSGNRKGERRVWRRRFPRHAIRNERDLENHFAYVRCNPVRHGYAKTLEEWPHSSFHGRGGGL